MDRNWVILILKTLKSADSTLSLICDEGLSFMVEQGGENVLSCDVLERQKLFIETRQRLKSDIPGACGDPIPLPPQNISATSIVSAEKESSVVLRWSLPLEVTSTALSYGVKSGEYIYGIPTLPTGNEFKINNLEPGREYYFVMQSTQGCSQSAFSDEVKVFVPGLVEKESTPAAVLKVNSIEDEKLINLPSPNVWRLLELDLLARIDIWSMYGVIFLLTSVFLLLSHSVTSRFRGNKNAKDDLSFWV
jgi:hypothetical protein